MSEERSTLGILLESGWWLVVGLHLWAIWTLPVFLTQDGASHIYSISVLLQLVGETSPVLHQIFEVNSRVVPNWLGSGLLLGLSSVLGYDGGEKAFISLYVLGLAFGFRVAIKAAGLQNPWGKFLILPLLFNHYLNLGFYNYLLGIVGSILVFAYGLKHLGSLGVRRAIVLGAGILAVYFTHILPAVLCGAGLTSLLVIKLTVDRKGLATWTTQLGLLFAAGAPAGLLCVQFLASPFQTHEVSWGRPLLDLLRETFSASILVPFERRAPIWIALCLATVAVVSGWVLVKKVRQRCWGIEDGLLLLGALVFAAQLTCPEGVQGGTIVSYRLGIYLWLAWIGWLLLQERLMEQLPFSAVLGSVFLIGGVFQPIHWVNHLAPFQPTLGALEEAADHIPAHSEVWPLVLNPYGRLPNGDLLSPRNPILSHVALRALATKEDVASRLVQQGESPLFPVRFKGSSFVSYFLEGFPLRPEDFPIDQVLQTSWTGSHPAFLLVVGSEPGEEVPPGSPLAIVVGRQAQREVSIDGLLGPVVLFRLGKQGDVE